MNEAVHVDPIVWLGMLSLIGVLLTIVGVLIKRDRDALSKDIKGVLAQAQTNHDELSNKVDRVEYDVGEINKRIGTFVTRSENDRSFATFFQEQRAERAELRGFLTGWLDRIERTLERKADRE